MKWIGTRTYEIIGTQYDNGWYKLLILCGGTFVEQFCRPSQDEALEEAKLKGYSVKESR